MWPNPRKMWIWSHLLIKSLMENIIFCEVCGPSIFILINIINVAPIFLEMKFDAEAYLRP